MRRVPTAVNLGFIHRTPFQTHYLSENLTGPRIEHGTSRSVAGTLTTRPQAIQISETGEYRDRHMPISADIAKSP
jgi:hypothetical protein